MLLQLLVCCTTHTHTALGGALYTRESHLLLAWVEGHGGREEEEGCAIVVVLEAEGDVRRKHGVVQDGQNFCVLWIGSDTLSVPGRRLKEGERGWGDKRHNSCITIKVERRWQL